MVLGVVLKLFGEGSLSSMSMFQLVNETGRRGHKISSLLRHGMKLKTPLPVCFFDKKGG